MNRQYKKIIFAFILCAVCMAPSLSFAKEAEQKKEFSGIKSAIQKIFSPSGDNVTTRTEQKKENQEATNNVQNKVQKPKLADDSNMKNGGFCFQLSTLSTNIESQIKERETALSDKRAKQEAEAELRKNANDEKLNARRSGWDDNRMKNIEKIMARAKTDAQKNAVQKFNNTVNSAVEARRQAIDAALSGFRADVLRLTSENARATDGAIADYRTAAEQALTSARATCARGGDQKIAKANYQAAMKAAKDHFEVDRTDAGKKATSVQTLSAEKKLLIEKANSTFETAIQNAVAELKKSF